MSAAEPGPGGGGEGGGEGGGTGAVAGSDSNPSPGGVPARVPPGEALGGRKARGRPRLTDSDRARRRLESRKKYDVRRVYLGEAHGAWTELRRRSGWSDAKLAAYLLGLERGQRAGRRGKPWEQLPKKTKWKKRRRRNVNCLRHAVLWYQDHRQRCPYEPSLAELDPSVGLYTTAVWQCQGGHRYFQDLHSPLRTLSSSDGDSEDEAPPGGSPPSSSSSSSSGGCSSGSELPVGGGPPAPPVALSPPEGAGGGLGAVVCVLGEGGPPPTLLQGPPLLILNPSYGALGGLQLEVGGGGGACALLEGGGPFPPPPLDPHIPKTEEEEEEVLGLKQEVLPPPPSPEPPQELPPPPQPEEGDMGGVSSIIYEVPKEPERRRSRRGRPPSPDPQDPPPCPRGGCGGVPLALSSFQNQVCPEHPRTRLRCHKLSPSEIREFPSQSRGKSLGRKNPRRRQSGETPPGCELCGFRCRHGGPGGLRPLPRPEGLKCPALQGHPQTRRT